MRNLILTAAFLVIAVPGWQAARAQSTSGFGKHTVSRSYPHTGVPLLDSFYLRFSSGDRHLEQLGVRPSTNRVWVAFHDDTRNDEFYYKVSHHSVSHPAIYTGTKSGICGKKNGLYSCRYKITRPAGNNVFVLRGFRVYYAGGDHHIDEIYVRESNGYLFVHFNDRNDDDTYAFSVDYAYLPASLIQRTGVSSGTRARGAARKYINSGRSVIRGFRFNFQPYFTWGGDHHIKEVGVMTPSGRIDVYYSDRNRDDGFDWSVDWAILNRTVTSSAVFSATTFK